MDKELKISVTLLFVLIILPPALLYSLAGISPFSKDFLWGYLPFLTFLVPYILLSSSHVVNFLQERFADLPRTKLILPLYLLAHYTILQFLYFSFQWNFFALFFLWIAVPTLIFCLPSEKSGQISNQDFVVALLLWLPIEYGFVRGYELHFSPQIRISALPFAAPLFGLYLFLLLRKLSDIGYTFLWRAKDLAIAFGALLCLAVILIPLGIGSGFIRFAIREVSTAEIFQLIFGIYFFVALPEELLFRGIIQNLLSKSIYPLSFSPLQRGRFSGGQWLALLTGSIIFGLAHYNNYSPPDWRYVFLSVIAGIFYGLTYMKTGKTTVSAIVHCGVNFIWTMVFKDTPG